MASLLVLFLMVHYVYVFIHKASSTFSTHTHQGCSAPLVVKVADTDREKNARRLQQTMVGLGGVNNIGLSAAAFGLGTLGAAAYYQQVSSDIDRTGALPW